MQSSLKRAKVYFVFIALAMVMTLLFISYGWGFSMNMSNTFPSRFFTVSNVVKRFGVFSNASFMAFLNVSQLTSGSVSKPSLTSKIVSVNQNAGVELLETSGNSNSHLIRTLTTNISTSNQMNGFKNSDYDQLKQHTAESDKHQMTEKYLNLTNKSPVGSQNHPGSNTSDIPSHTTKASNSPSTTMTTPDVPKESSLAPSVQLTNTNGESLQTHQSNHTQSVESLSGDIKVLPESQVDSLKETLSNENIAIPSDMDKKYGTEINNKGSAINANTILTTASSISEQQGDTNHLQSGSLEESLKNSNLRNAEIQNKANEDKPETSESKNKAAAHRYSVIDQLKYGRWNPVDVNRAARDPSDKPTVRPDICKGCFKTDFRELISAPDVCQPGANVSVLMMIASSPTNQEARQVIRSSWGRVCSDPASTIRCVFVFGQHSHERVNGDLAVESEQYHDIVQFAFHDAYANLTYKTMMSMKWASTNCKSANYVMKTDDDMYVNTELLPLLVQGAPGRRFFGGFCWGPSPPHRDRSSKWYVSFEQFAQPLYPTMCSGTGYVMSRDVMEDVLAESVDVPFFYLEDVYVSLCLKRKGIRPKSLTGFSNTKVEYKSCAFRNRVITSHGHPPSELRFIWEDIQSCRREILTPQMVYSAQYAK